MAGGATVAAGFAPSGGSKWVGTKAVWVNAWAPPVVGWGVNIQLLGVATTPLNVKGYCNAGWTKVQRPRPPFLRVKIAENA